MSTARLLQSAAFRPSLFLAALAVAAAAALPAAAQTTVAPAAPAAALSPAQARWMGTMASFAAADREHAPASGGVLFVGSSTIRLWTDLAQDFRQQPVVINRGFGGSTMADCNFFVKELVTQYRPRHVVVYAGDNDLAEGRSPGQVLDSFRDFVHTVRKELPDTRISYVSIKPSPLRAAMLPQVRETNAMIANHVQSLANAEYIDIFTPMLAADGMPRPELYRGDRLHMNEAGYALWQSIIAPRLAAPGATMQAGAESAPSHAAATISARSAVTVTADSVLIPVSSLAPAVSSGAAGATSLRPGRIQLTTTER